MSGEATNLRRNALLVGAANLLSRITGLLREVAFAAVFGAGAQADAYNAAFRIGSLFRELFAEGSLSSAFIPLYADVDEKEGQASALALANAFLGVLLLAVGAATVLTFVFAEPLVYVIAAGYADVPGKVELTAKLTRILSPFIATISMAAVFMGMLNVRGRFFLPAVAPVIFNGLTIAACLLAPAFGEATGQEPVLAVAIAALAGGASQALIQVPALRRGGWRFKITLGKHPALKRLIKFIVPALIAISVVQVNLLIEMQLASREGDGPVSWLFYSFKIVHLPFSIVSGAVGVSALAGLSVLAAQKKWDDFRGTLAHALTLNSFLLMPAAVGLFVLAEPVVALLLERGAFRPEDTVATAAMLRMYCIAVMGIGAHRVLVPVYYTLDDPRTPMWAGLATVALKLPVALALMYPLGMGVQGLPLSHGILVTAEVLLLVLLLRRRVPGLIRALIKDQIRVVLAAAVMGGVIWTIRGWAGSGGEPDVIGLIGVILIGVVCFFLTAALMGLREGREIVGRVLQRRPKGLPPTVDPETARLLHHLAAVPHGDPALVDGALTIATADEVVTVVARDGVLTATAAPAATADGLAVGPMAAVMRVGGGPPQLSGLIIGESSFRASGDQVEPGQASGPVLPIEPAELSA